MKHKITNKKKREVNLPRDIKRNGSPWAKRMCGSPSNGAARIGSSVLRGPSFVRRGTLSVVLVGHQQSLICVGSSGGCRSAFMWVSKEIVIVRSPWVTYCRSFTVGHLLSFVHHGSSSAIEK